MTEEHEKSKFLDRVWESFSFIFFSFFSFVNLSFHLSYTEYDMLIDSKYGKIKFYVVKFSKIMWVTNQICPWMVLLKNNPIGLTTLFDIDRQFGFVFKWSIKNNIFLMFCVGKIKVGPIIKRGLWYYHYILKCNLNFSLNGYLIDINHNAVFHLWKNRKIVLYFHFLFINKQINFNWYLMVNIPQSLSHKLNRNAMAALDFCKYKYFLASEYPFLFHTKYINMFLINI